MCPKDACTMANSVDPDQTAPSEAVWSRSTMFADLSVSIMSSAKETEISVTTDDTGLLVIIGQKNSCLILSRSKIGGDWFNLKSLWWKTCCNFNIWACEWQNQQNDLCTSEDSDQPGHPSSLIRVFSIHMKKHWVLNYLLSPEWTLIWLGRCPSWSESLLGAHVILLVLSCSGSYTVRVKKIPHFTR